jgi:putative hydrolase of the HAD superfamily
MIREVIFDIDSTLYDYDKSHAAAMSELGRYVREHFGREQEEFEKDYQRLYHELMEELGMDNAAIHSRHLRIQRLLEEWNEPLFPHLENMYRAYWDTLLRVSEPEPGSLECMKRLRQMGITIGIGTDMTAYMQYEKLIKLGFGPYINHVVTSQEAGQEKPGERFMSLCIRKSGAAPEECLFVGDNPSKDIAGSVRAGMHACWYRPDGSREAKKPDVPEGSYQEIRHFDEVIPYILTIG